MTAVLEPGTVQDVELLQQIQLQHLVEQFLYLEALLIDERRLVKSSDVVCEAATR